MKNCINPGCLGLETRATNGVPKVLKRTRNFLVLFVMGFFSGSSMLLVMIVAVCFGFGFGLIEWIIAAGSLGTKMFMCFKAMMKHIMMMPVLVLFVFKFHKFDFESKSQDCCCFIFYLVLLWNTIVDSQNVNKVHV